MQISKVNCWLYQVSLKPFEAERLDRAAQLVSMDSPALIHCAILTYIKATEKRSGMESPPSPGDEDNGKN